MTPTTPPNRDTALVKTLTSVPGRLAIINYIRSTTDGAYFSEIAEGASIPEGSISSHLRPLEEHGAIEGDIPQNKRHGRSVKYRVNLERIKEAFDNTRDQFIA